MSNLDIPPLLTVASWYLRHPVPGTVDRVRPDDPRRRSDRSRGSACLPNWRIDDVAGPFDVFVNSYSFQEMEPDVVKHYVARVAAKERVVRRIAQLPPREAVGRRRVMRTVCSSR